MAQGLARTLTNIPCPVSPLTNMAKLHGTLYSVFCVMHVTSSFHNSSTLFLTDSPKYSGDVAYVVHIPYFCIITSHLFSVLTPEHHLFSIKDKSEDEKL